ncbi:MAG TPA: type II secretion system protein [Candidatus Acidoferrum sp.]|nr:type II secretion system protein [Candidatus Acidoferrum sp.]
MKALAIRRAGFTLVEIMIVVAIISMLAAIAIPNFVRARSQSQTNACINNLRQIDDATQEWALDTLQYPTATVTFDAIRPYLKNQVTCPSAGDSGTFASSYTLTTVSNKPTCNYFPATHMLQPDGDGSHLTPPGP